ALAGPQVSSLVREQLEQTDPGRGKGQLVVGGHRQVLCRRGGLLAVLLQALLVGDRGVGLCDRDLLGDLLLLLRDVLGGRGGVLGLLRLLILLVGRLGGGNLALALCGLVLDRKSVV